MARKIKKPKKNPSAFDLILAERARKAHEDMMRRIDDHIAWVRDHPSVHDRKPC